MRPEARAALLPHLRGPRYEVFPAPGIEDELSEHVPTDVKITVTASPRRGTEVTLAHAEEIARRGYHVAPHLSARLIRDETELVEVISRVQEIGLRDVFVVA